MIIGISGNARSGKDSLFDVLMGYFKDGRRFSLGDILKEDLDAFCFHKFGIYASTIDETEKKLIRPFLVEYARIVRFQSQGTYFTSKIEPEIKQYDGTAILTDIRYDEYQNDEYSWLKRLGGKLIFVERTLDGITVPPPNEDERINNLKLKQNADLVVKWPTLSPAKRNLFFRERYSKVIEGWILEEKK